MKTRYLYGIVGLWLLTMLCCKSQKISPKAPSSIATPTRGVWLTNVSSLVYYSDQNIKDAVALCDSLGFNTIYAVAWNRGMTLYPSKVMKNLTGVEMDPKLKGRDPIKLLIDEAKSRGIKVYAWFEFGFSCSYRDATGGPIIQAKPNWAARDAKGNIATKNNFQWMNAFDPEVQRFMTDLIVEFVQNYDVAGIQGDDRLPALPSNAGYDAYTTQLYKAENFGQSPPSYEQDYDWTKWRSGKLTQYLEQLVKSVKQAKPNVRISMAPSIYPWSEQNYLQDWPTWLSKGLVDEIIPQIYRYKQERYEHELRKIVESQVSADNLHKFIPGMLLQVEDAYTANEALLDSMIQTNRKYGIDREVFFFYEGIKKHKIYFKKLYKAN